MKFKKILIVIGTRPEAIKMLPLLKVLRGKKRYCKVEVLVTGQHKELLKNVLSEFSITPDYDLEVMREKQTLSELTSNILLNTQRIFIHQNFDAILVHGDTTTTLSVALAAFYHNIPVGHVEAGLRTNDLSAPFPEELNRQMVSRIAKWNFAPTKLAKQQLIAENIKRDTIHITGNTVVDALYQNLEIIDQNPVIKSSLEQQIEHSLGFNWKENQFILVTGHRRENFGENFAEIFRTIKALATQHPNTYFVYPLHLNPNVREPVNEILRGIANVKLTEPLEYKALLLLLRECFLVLTDSGGIQEEAPCLGKPVLVMREKTERPEALEEGVVKLVGANSKLIFDTVSNLLNSNVEYSKMAKIAKCYGDGKASVKISEILLNDI